jgi:cysteinyl-tRNA synthetase
MSQEQLHWADSVAKKILKENQNNDSICCASGITPSGTVHIGNFREMITTELIVRALKKQTDKKVRFIYSWDDYDVFRKVPKNMPNQEMLIELLIFLTHLVEMSPMQDIMKLMLNQFYQLLVLNPNFYTNHKNIVIWNTRKA